MATTKTRGPAYDYDAQKWIDDGPAAEVLHRKQLLEERDLIAGPDGAEYLRSIGISEPVSEALAVIDATMAELTS